jgi:hypothetical protein
MAKWPRKQSTGPNGVFRQGLAAGYRRGRVVGCQRDQHPTTATFHLGQFSFENLGNAVFTNTRT